MQRVARQLDKADPNANNKELRTFGTLGVLRHLIRDRGTRFFLCQFKPEHNLNEDTLAHYQNNRLRVVPELVLFVNGLPVATRVPFYRYHALHRDIEPILQQQGAQLSAYSPVHRCPLLKVVAIGLRPERQQPLTKFIQTMILWPSPHPL